MRKLFSPQKNLFLARFVRSIFSLFSPLEPEGNELFQEWLPSHTYIPAYIWTTGTYPCRRRREREGGREGGWSFDDYPKLLPRCCRAFVPDATRGETRQRRPRLPADPYYGRHCASSARTSQKAEGSCSRIVISGARTALSPWLWARIDFVDGASFHPPPLAPPLA